MWPLLSITLPNADRFSGLCCGQIRLFVFYMMTSLCMWACFVIVQLPLMFFFVFFRVFVSRTVCVVVFFFSDIIDIFSCRPIAILINDSCY